MNDVETHSQKLPQDFRLLLQGALAQRCRANPKYSLRAFAKFLRVDHATLSQILRGVRPITPKMIERLGLRLGLAPDRLAAYLGGSDRAFAARATKAADGAQDLSLDAFSVIADWYHYAIFELVTLKTFKPEARWIARTLGLTVSEVNIAVERLRRLGLLETGPKGKWTQGAPLITTTGNPFTAVAFRKLQAQLLQQALAALESVPMELRDQSSMTMAINTRRIPEAKERIKKFRRELCGFLQEDADRDAVFQLSVSLFPTTPIVQKKEFNV